MSKRNRKRDLERKQQERLLHAECVQTEFPKITYEELIERGIEHWNADLREPQQHPVTLDTDINTLERLAVNYARHILSLGYDASYRRPLKSLSYRERKEAAVKQALRQIAIQWPQLTAECLRQEKERLM
jgi:hypothetical protein